MPKEQWEASLKTGEITLGDELRHMLSGNAEIDAGPVRQSSRDPEKVLILAVLQDAIVTIRDHANSRNKVKRAAAKDAMKWMAEDPTAAKAYIQASTSIPDDAKERLMNGGGWGGMRGMGGGPGGNRGGGNRGGGNRGGN